MRSTPAFGQSKICARNIHIGKYLRIRTGIHKLLSLALRPLAIGTHPRPLPIATGFIQHSRGQISLGYTPDKGAWVHQGQRYHSTGRLSGEAAQVAQAAKIVISRIVMTRTPNNPSILHATASRRRPRSPIDGSG
jgi:hypothetical protein